MGFNLLVIPAKAETQLVGCAVRTVGNAVVDGAHGAPYIYIIQLWQNTNFLVVWWTRKACPPELLQLVDVLRMATLHQDRLSPLTVF